MGNFRLSNFKFSLSVFIVFVAVAIIGMTLHENVRKITAQTLGYEGHFCKGWGQLLFSNEKLQNDIRTIRESNIEAIKSNQFFKDRDKWDALVLRDRKDEAMIELSGLIFTFSLSMVGLLILLLRRKTNPNRFRLVDWSAVFLSLFIVKEAVTSFQRIYFGRMLCDHAKLAEYFGMPVFLSEWILLIYSMLFSVLILLRFVPRNRLFLFVLAGILGGITAVILWLLFAGNMLFP
jgi:hypothetical protein